MIIVISPAKKLDMQPEQTCLSKCTQPLFTQHALALIEQLRVLDAKALEKLMGISTDLAELNKSRFQEWSLPFTEDNAKAALLAFKGDVYQGMDVASFSKQDFEFAQKQLRILSGLYGCLRPKDLMQAYRLEMGTALKNRSGNNLYDFWKELVTDYLNKELAKDKSRLLVNLASGEYFKVIDAAKLNAEVITPVFKDFKNGQYKVISFLAKKARGMMSAYLIKNRIENSAEICNFAMAGYQFNTKASTATELVFLRK